MIPLFAFADLAALGTVALSALTAFFAYLAGRDKLRFDAKVVLLEKTVADNATDMTEVRAELVTVRKEYEACREDRYELRDQVNSLKLREAERHGLAGSELPGNGA
jgi:uncharacterized membrane protein